MNRFKFIAAWLSDARLGSRLLFAKPAHVIIAIVTSALGITATTTVFSLAYGVWLKPLPYPESDRLVLIYDRSSVGKQSSVSMPELEDYKAADVFTDIASYAYNAGFATVDGERQRIVAYWVAPQLFSVLGVSPTIGRLFGTAEAAGRAPGVILSDSFWRARFGGNLNVIGRTLMMNDTAYPIVGVMPRGFRFPQLLESDVWVPFGLRDNDRARRSYKAIARLRAGVTVEDANLRLAAVAERLVQAYPATNTGWSAQAVPLIDNTFGPYRSAFSALLGLAGLFFAIACINVATLLLTRADARRIDLGVQIALGADRKSLARQFVTQGMLVSAIGGLVGVALSASSVPLFAAVLPPNTPRVADVGVTSSACVAAALLSLAAGAIFGLVPTLALGRMTAFDAIRPPQARSGGSSRLLGSGLILAEVALSVVLLVGATMMVRSVIALLSEDRGFRPDHLLTLDVALPFPRPRYQSATARAEAFRELVDRLQDVPGVTSVGSTAFFPGSSLGTGIGIATFRLPGAPETNRVSVTVHTSSPDFFRTMGVSLKRGRVFSRGDLLASARVAIVNETLAMRLWPTEDPIGRELDLHDASPFVPGDKPFEIVGIVRNTYLRTEPSPEIFVPELGAGYVTDLLIRTDRDPQMTVGAVRQVIRGLDPELAIEYVATMDSVVDKTFGLERAQSYLAGFVALLAAILSGVGVYGVFSYAVTRRRRELGIRLALGANPRSLFTLVLGRALWLTITGLIVGVLAALGMIRLLRALVFGLSGPSTVAILVVATLLLVIALCATWAPARRAFLTDPLPAIRQG
ncbi:MAG TPA: ABC transporter permease [Vicinamibacterales bacterium]|nr:ABC transporter permease [Vicinamibacterales bacterium]